MKTNPPLRGELLAKTAVNQILLHPETWDQKAWHSPCKTKHCFAGWCQILSGHAANDGRAQSEAAEALGLTPSESEWFFRASCSLSELHYLASHFSDGYGRDGYGRDGYGRDGYGRDGYGRDGYGRDGYGRDGYGRDGYGRDGKMLKPFDLSSTQAP